MHGLFFATTPEYFAPIHHPISFFKQETGMAFKPHSDGHLPIPGTEPFDDTWARKGYALNKMCFSFNDAANRNAFVADEEGYMQKYGLSEEQAAAIRARNVLQLLAAGGNAYYLAKFAGIFKLDMQDIGAQQTGVSKDEFKAKLVAANHQPGL
jgi:protocatechuate 4,5-dioxygenase, alpha chain